MLTKKEALFYTKIIWDQTAHTLDKMMAVYDLKMESRFIHDCPLCQYKVETEKLKDVAHTSCNNCLLFDLWNMHGEEKMLCPCEDNGFSPYTSHLIVEDYDAEFFALLISEEAGRLHDLEADD